MSDHPTGRRPNAKPLVPDPAVEGMMAQWIAATPDSIDVEAALAGVTARRRADGESVDELATRRAVKRVGAAVPVWRRAGFRAAAAVIAIAGAAALWRGTRTAPGPSLYATTVGAAQQIRLADGTEVRLGPASSLQLVRGFGDAHRRVTLQGEAWFTVTHDASKPFVITVGSTTVEDVGTAFSIRESPSRAVSVRVGEGIVRVRVPAASGDSSVTLRAGDRAITSAGGITVATGVVSADDGSALSAGRLVFDDASLVEVQDALQRWYGVHLVVADSALASRHLTADFTGEPVSRVASVLSLTLGTTASTRGDTIELRDTAGAPTRR
ncbi:MAG TPA: FecR domain-containing protein [Gemmatimonadaceae bacterium]|nr:FecR domain-containing protein [Gemmatimonadaceae bacterium]